MRVRLLVFLAVLWLGLGAQAAPISADTSPQQGALTLGDRPPSPLNFGQAHLAPFSGSELNNRSGEDGNAGNADGVPNANMTYHNGPVLQDANVYVIFWLPSGFHLEPPPSKNAAYRLGGDAGSPALIMNNATDGAALGDRNFESLITRFFTDLNDTAYYGLMGQYSSIQDRVTLGGQYVYTGAYPHAGTTADPLLPEDFQAAIESVKATTGWQSSYPAVGARSESYNMFFVYTGYGVYNCEDGANAPCNFINSNASGYCAYHSAYFSPPATISSDIGLRSGGITLWADMGNEGTDPDPVSHQTTCAVGGYTGSKYPNDDASADSTVNVTSHELFESVTDPIWASDGQHGWTDSDGGSGEIGDKCAWHFGTIATDGSDLTLNGHNYIVQQEWSNATFDGHTNYSGCTLLRTASVPRASDVAALTATSTSLASCPGQTQSQNSAHAPVQQGQLQNDVSRTGIGALAGFPAVSTVPLPSSSSAAGSTAQPQC